MGLPSPSSAGRFGKQASHKSSSKNLFLIGFQGTTSRKGSSTEHCEHGYQSIICELDSKSALTLVREHSSKCSCYHKDPFSSRESLAYSPRRKQMCVLACVPSSSTSPCIGWLYGNPLPKRKLTFSSVLCLFIFPLIRFFFTMTQQERTIFLWKQCS